MVYDSSADHTVCSSVRRHRLGTLQQKALGRSAHLYSGVFDYNADHAFRPVPGRSDGTASGAAIIAASIISIHSILFSSRSQIKGLTTTAALWSMGLIGLASGAGFYTIMCFGFVAVYCVLSVFPALEISLKDHSNHFEIHLELTNSSYLKDFITVIRKLGLIIDDIEFNTAYTGSGLSVYTIALSIQNKDLKQYKTHAEIIEALSTLEYIYHIEEIKM